MTVVLRPGVVHVCWGRVGSQVGPGLPEPEALLSTDEAARAQKMAEGLAKRQFVAGRALLRATLARATGIEPGALCFCYGEHGKPFLPQGPSFSLSHSDDRVVVAVGARGPTEGGRVGVDVEVVRPVRRMEAVVRRRFAPEEAQWWACQPPDKKVAAFFDIWTRKEAVAKALGEGLAAPWRAFAVAVQEDGPAGGGLQRFDLPGEQADQWRVVGLQCSRAVAAAVATDWPATVVTLRNNPCPS